MNKLLLDKATWIRDADDLYETEFWEQGNFVVCTIQRKSDQEIVSVGVSKRNPECDAHDEERGNVIAFIRAVREMDGWETDDKDVEISL